MDDTERGDQVAATTEPEPAAAVDAGEQGLPFGTYVAVEPLFVDGFTLAHAPGDLVRWENIERNGWADKVARIDVPEGDGGEGEDG